MSGIYIPGIEMPTNCLDCPVYWDKCPNWDAEGNEYSERIHPDCPLVPVPEHGPLVDALEVINAFPEEFIFTNEQARALTNYIIPADPPVMYYPQVPGITPTVIAEEVYDEYTDTAGNHHWKGTLSGEHIIPAEEGEG